AGKQSLTRARQVGLSVLTLHSPKDVAGNEEQVTRQQNHETATFNRNLSFYASNQAPWQNARTSRPESIPVWRRSLELLQTHFGSPVSSGVLRTLAFLAAALVAVEICSRAPVPNHSGNYSQKEVLANTEVPLAPDAPTSVSIVPKLPKSL